MKGRRNFVVMLVVFSLCLVFLLSVNQPAKAQSEPSGIVMLYSSMQEDQLIAIKQAFEDLYPNVRMEYYFAGTGKVVTKIAAEAQAGRVGADIIWVADPTEYISFKKLGILEAYSSPEAAAIDPAYIDDEFYFTGARMMNMGISYNTMLVNPEEAPRTWEDLLDAKWYDQIVMTDPGTAGTSNYWLNAMLGSEKYGESYLQKLKDNGCYVESGSTATHNQLAAGAYKVGICLDYITANLANQGSPIAYLFPEEDVVSIFSPIALVKNSANQENGKLLFDFILSLEGQELLFENNLVAVHPDVDQGDLDVRAIAKKALSTDLNEMAERSAENLDKFDKIFGL